MKIEIMQWIFKMILAILMDIAIVMKEYLYSTACGLLLCIALWIDNYELGKELRRIRNDKTKV